MELIFLGSGGAFTLGDGNYQSNMVLESSNGRRLLIDCGTDARFSLSEQGLTAGDIDAVYISHCHSDHVGGLEWLGFSTYFIEAGARRPQLIAHREILDILWEHSLRAGMDSIGTGPAGLESFFEIHEIVEDQPLRWQDVELTSFRVVHHQGADGTAPAFGLEMYLPDCGTRHLLTTDTRYTPERLMPRFEQMDRIFHDCETAAYPSKIHAHYDELLQLPAAIRAKTWLYHFQPGPLPDARSAGFLGFVAKGQRFNLRQPEPIPRPVRGQQAGG